VRIIILSAGYIDYTHLPVGTNTSNAMIPINGKPVIAWILQDLADKGTTDITLVMREEDVLLAHFIQNFHVENINLSCVKVKNSRSILDSLAHGLATITDRAVGVLLGDTLIRDSFTTTENFVYTANVEDSHRWCLIEKNEQDIITNYHDKERGQADHHEALCGYYHFSDAGRLKESLQHSLQHDKKQLSDLLRTYQDHHPIRAIAATQWYDFGNIDNLVNSKQRLLQSRYFNSLTIDPLLNTITKVSEFDDKLRSELNWYEELPDVLRVLSPRIISKREVDGKLHLVQEYYGYPTLAELFIFSTIDPEIWSSVFKKLLAIHKVFKGYNYALTASDCYDIYYKKTVDRLSALRQNQEWNELLKAPLIQVNGAQRKGFDALMPSLVTRVDRLCAKVNGAIIHGDFCFSNILFDYGNQIIRLIDPRGSFGKKMIYGDPRYDIAKLRHSIAGRYDLIVSDLFTLEENGGEFTIKFFPIDNFDTLAADFDKQVHDLGYDLSEIKLIEGLLFISMLPLHQDKPIRQKMMYLRGLELLNEILTN
jgi:dTDP-glucose pyrophosphorylase